MTREQYKNVWNDAHYIFKQSRLNDVRRAAKRIAMAVETIIGQQDDSAERWDV